MKKTRCWRELYLPQARRLRPQLCLLVIGLLLVGIVSAEIPAGYYAEAQGLSDSLLRQALYDTIRGGVRIHYGTQGYTYPDKVYYPGTWNCFPQTDVRTDGTVWDMYSNTKRYFPHDGGSACGLEIEHCLPKSWWGWTKSDTASSKRAYQDLYILNPSDGSANGNKSNYPPGHVVKGDKFDNGSFRMDKANSSQYGWICFEPAEEYRGDFARTYFYVATAYADLPFGAGNAELQRYLTDSTYLVFKPWLVEVLLDWHRADPVSEKERRRAETVFSIQGNRNPYIDYPELVEYIWGNKKGQAVDFGALVCTADSSYIPNEDFTNFEAFAPIDVTSTGFTARWSDFDTDYTLDVYQRSYTGHNDTLVSMPAMGTSFINSSTHVKTGGRVSSTGAGSNAITMGVGASDGLVIVYDLGLTAPARLTFRANVYKSATAGELRIFFNADATADTTITLPTSRDEIWYTIPLAAGTDSVTIRSLGGSTTKRACMQALYVVQGDWQAVETSVVGYPQEVHSHSQFVTLPSGLTGETIYYRVKTAEGKVSNEIAIEVPKATVAHGTQHNPANAQKVLREQEILIYRNGKQYNVLGNQIR